LRAYVLVVAT